MTLIERAQGLAAVAIVLALSLSACSDTKPGQGVGGGSGGGADAGTDGDAGRTYTMSLICEPTAGAECPAGQPCPEVPLSSTSCGDLPAIADHAAIPLTNARPIGCRATLPYENPYYAGMETTCYCMDFGTTHWVCAL